MGKDYFTSDLLKNLRFMEEKESIELHLNKALLEKEAIILSKVTFWNGDNELVWKATCEAWEKSRFLMRTFYQTKG